MEELIEEGVLSSEVSDMGLLELSINMKVPRNTPQPRIEEYFTRAIAGALKGRTLRCVDIKLRVRRRRLISQRCDINLALYAVGETSEIEQLEAAMVLVAQGAAQELRA